jgi:hypothetical protein
VPQDSVYSGVVSLRGFRTVLFLAEMNSLPVWATDIENAYLIEAQTDPLSNVKKSEFTESEFRVFVSKTYIRHSFTNRTIPRTRMIFLLTSTLLTPPKK